MSTPATFLQVVHMGVSSPANLKHQIRSALRGDALTPEERATLWRMMAHLRVFLRAGGAK